MRACKDCKVAKDLDAFEKTTKDGKHKRAVCTPCYAANEVQHAKDANKDVDRTTIPKPDACVECGKGAGKVDFRWRGDIKQGGWRSVSIKCCNAKGYREDSRKRERAKDEAAYLARIAAKWEQWAHAVLALDIVYEYLELAIGHGPGHFHLRLDPRR